VRHGLPSQPHQERGDRWTQGNASLHLRRERINRKFRIDKSEIPEPHFRRRNEHPQEVDRFFVWPVSWQQLALNPFVRNSGNDILKVRFNRLRFFFLCYSSLADTKWGLVGFVCHNDPFPENFNPICQAFMIHVQSLSLGSIMPSFCWSICFCGFLNFFSKLIHEAVRKLG